MDDKKYQVFISSTYKDLVDSRDKIIETVLSLYHFPVGMEMFSAGDAEQWDIIKETINVSDYYVIIIGHRYGSVTSEGISYTEKEYDYAKERGLPVLAFIRNRDVSTKPHERETSPDKIAKLDAFIEKAMSNKMCDFWDGVDDLATKVAIALPKIFRRTPQVGWVRGDLGVSKEVSQELAALSTDNRKLRADIKELEDLAKRDKPKISIKLDSLDSLSIDSPEIDINRAVRVPEPLELASIPRELQGYIEFDDIPNYNQNLPDKEAVDKYNEDMKYYLAADEAVYPDFEITNEGFSKANDVFVTLTFPKIVQVVEADDIKGLRKPENPIPTSPIEKARKRHSRKRSISSILDPLENLPFMMNSGSSLDVASLNFSPNRNVNYHYSIEGNTLTFRLNSLIHTRTKVFKNDIALIPIEKGESEIEIKIICEEYKHQDSFSMPIIISGSTQ